MTEPTYSVFRLTSESSKQLGFSKQQSSSLNNDRMNMKWLKHEMLRTKFSLQHA